MENIQLTTPREYRLIRSATARSSVYTSFSLIAFFLVMRLFDLHRHLELHYLNVVILFFGLRYVIKDIIYSKGAIRYFEGLKAGLIVTVISVISFNIFLLIYETLIDPSFLILLKENISFGNALPFQGIIFNLMGIVTIEGLSSGFILTYMLMQYYKDESSETK